MCDPLGQQREYIAGASPAKHDCELANADATVEFTDSAHAGNKEPDTGQDSFSWTEISLRAFAAIPTRN